MDFDQGYELYEQINKIRINPQSYIKDIKDQLLRFESNFVYKVSNGDRMKVMEGKSAWHDAIRFLQRQKSVGTLRWNASLAGACQQYFNQFDSGIENPNAFNLAKKYCNYTGQISFNINQCPVKLKVRELICSLVVGDGDQNRAIFHPQMKEYASCYAKTRVSGYISPMFFAQNVMETFGVGNLIKQKIKGMGYQSKQAELRDQNIGKNLLSEINETRKNPKEWVIPLKKQMALINQQKKQLIKQKTIIKLEEGKPAYQEAIQQLNQSFPIPIIKWSEGLAVACQEYCIQQICFKHHDFNQLIKKYTIAGSSNLSTFTFTGNKDCNQVISSMLVSDGDKKRCISIQQAIRRKMLSPIVKHMGAAMIPYQNAFMAVLCFSDSIIKDNQNALYLRNNQISKEVIHEPYKPMSKKVDEVHEKFSNLNLKQKQQRNVQKKVSKSKIIIKNGEKYKITTTTIQYDNGDIQEEQEQHKVH